MNPFILELQTPYCFTWKRTSFFKVNSELEKKKVEPNEQVVCQYVSMIFELQSLEAAQKMLMTPWYKIFESATASEDYNPFATISGGSCSQALGLAMKFSPQPENYILCSKTNKVVVPLPFDFSGSSSWPLDLCVSNFFEIKLGCPANAQELQICNTFLQMHCVTEKKPTRRIVSSTKPQIWTISECPKFCIPIRYDFTPSTNIRYIYFVISDEHSGEIYQGPIDANLLVYKNQVVINGQKFNASVSTWKSALCDHVVTSNAASQLSNLPAYIWQRKDGEDIDAISNSFLADPSHKLEIKGSFSLPDKFKPFSVKIEAFIVADKVICKAGPKTVCTYTTAEESTIPVPAEQLSLEQLDKRIKALENKK